MKKIIILIVFTFSLQSTVLAYTVSQNSGVKINKSDINKNNTQIESVVKKEMTEYVIKTKEDIDKENLESVIPLSNGELFIDIETIEDVLFSYLYTESALMDIYNNRNIGYEIEKINYVSPKKAELTIILKGPNLDLLDKDRITKKSEEIFKSKMGYSVKEAITRKWKKNEEVSSMTELLKISIKTLAEELNSLENTNKRKEVIILNKNNNKWEIELSN